MAIGGGSDAETGDGLCHTLHTVEPAEKKKHACVWWNAMLHTKAMP
jgi:hypothetical protein